MKKNLLPALPVFLLATAARADGVSPVLNLFHSGTWLPAAAVTAAIVLVESLLLRWWLRPTTYWRALKWSFLLNVASSCAGSVLLLLFGRDSYFVWDAFSFVVPLFLVTLATEIPLLRALSKAHAVSWKRILSAGLGMNVASYAAVFALEIGLFAAFLSRAGARDARDLAAWQNPRLLEKFSGALYGTAAGPGRHLRVFDPQTQIWTDLTNGPAIDPQKWDAENDRCAFVDWDTKRLKIARLPDFSGLREIPTEPFEAPPRTGYGHWQGVVGLALSPDAKLLAILFRTDGAVAYRDESSYFHLGDACRLIVLDAETGEEIARAPRRASGDLCWLPNSRSVLFSSFENESLYDVPRSAVRGTRSYGAGYAKDNRFATRLYAFRLDTGEVAPFAQGHAPSLAPRAQTLFVQDGNDVRILDPAGRETGRVRLPALWGAPVAAPDGALLLAQILRRHPFAPGGAPVLLDPAAPDVRHALPGAYFSYRYDWTAANPAP